MTFRFIPGERALSSIELSVDIEELRRGYRRGTPITDDDEANILLPSTFPEVIELESLDGGGVGDATIPNAFGAPAPTTNVGPLRTELEISLLKLLSTPPVRSSNSLLNRSNGS
jgi:hypothetical protein